MRLLDVGCGWGGMVMHAAREYGVQALGVTLSKQQAEWAQKAIAEAGLSELAEVRHLDYRDVTEDGFDAVSSIGLTEHIGMANLPSYFAFLYGRLSPAAGCSTTASPGPTTPSRAIRKTAASSTATSSRTASSRGPAISSPRCTTPASRCATRRTSASTTR